MLRTQNTSGQVTNFYGNTIGATYEFSPTNVEREKFPNSLVIITKYMEIHGICIVCMPDATWFPFAFAVCEWTVSGEWSHVPKQ